MHIEKQVLAELPDVYTTADLKIDGEDCFVAAPETRGECLLFRSSAWSHSYTLVEELGGCMSLVPIPGKRSGMLAIEGFYPVFQAGEAGVDLIRDQEEKGSLSKSWSKNRVFDLPFVHRIEVVETGDGPYVVASSLAEDKDTPEDWSRSGATYVAKIPEKQMGSWELKKVIDGLHKNHGMHVTELFGKEVVLVSGQEGIYELTVPRSTQEEWKTRCLIDREVSDVFVYDLDRDGKPELLTIEPFHGDTLGLYRNQEGEWVRAGAYPINFGHVVWAGELLGKPRIIAGSREGEEDLTVLQWDRDETRLKKDFVIDSNVGPSQITVLSSEESDLVFSANNGTGEVALYEISE